MAKITKGQMDILIRSFLKIMNNNDMETKQIIIKNLNNIMTEIFNRPITENYMFGYKNYDCFITFNNTNIKFPSLIVSFNRRLKCRQIKLGKDYYASFSHQIDFSQFCFENCNPDILHILERVLFEMA